MRLPLLTLCAILVLTSLYPQEYSFQALDLDPLLTKNANAIVRLDEMKIDIASHKSLTYEVKQVVTVLNKLGNSHASTQLYYDKEKKIKNIDILVYDQLGKEIKHIKRKDFQDLSAADGFSLYNDDRLLYHRYTPIQYPYTLEFTYEVESSDTGFFPPWYFISGYLVSVEKSNYEINFADETLKPEIKEYNLDGISYDKKETSNSIQYSADQIPALKQEYLSPDFVDIVPRLKVRMKHFNLKGVDASVANWNDLGAWIDNELLKNRDDLTEETKMIGHELVKGIDDTLEKARIIYQYVQDNTRYISVQIGIGGWQPISAIDVDKVKYGDCKGLSNYTKALLKEVGVESYYVVVHAGNAKINFDKDFSVLQGNHAILAIPYNDEYFWIDCTSQVNPFGFIGDFTDDRDVLVVKPNGGEIVRTKAYLNGQNKQLTTASYRVSDQGSLTGEVEISTKGVQYSNRLHLENETKEDIVKYYKKYWHNINNLNIGSFGFLNDKNEISMKETVSLEAKNYASISQNRILFALNPFNKIEHVPKRYRVRKRPFEILRGFLDMDEYEINIPSGYSIEALPASQTIKTEFGEYTVTIESKDGQIIRYNKSFALNSGTYPPEKYKEYRDFRKKVAKQENAKVVLTKNKVN
jgi:transglutaminase-like putative cysteine protease